MAKKPIHLDHIDPVWTKGRDYQLVCGLDGRHGPHGLANMRERDPLLNISKSNRFLPYRVCADEIGVVPVEQGDLCLFLDPDAGEWVLEEFMGTWWWEQSARTDSRAQPKGPHSEECIENKSRGIKKAWENNETHREIVIMSNKTRGVSQETKDKTSESMRLSWI